MTEDARANTNNPVQATAQSVRLPLGLRIAFMAFSSLVLLAALFAPAFIFADNTHRLILFGRCLALAFVAVSADLIWGYTGLLSLGQALYFGVGAYIVAFSLKLQEAAARYNAVWRTNVAPGQVPPDFMVDYGSIDLSNPDYVHPPAMVLFAPLGNIWVALAAAIVVPMIVGLLFSLLTFHRRIKGVYFSLITQALVLVAFLIADNQQPLTGGRPGINEIANLKLGDFTFHSKSAADKLPIENVNLLGMTLNRNRNLQDLYLLIGIVFVVCFAACFFLVRSKFGKILTAIRDNEARVLALGYNTAMYKVFVFTLAAGLAGLGGALVVPIIGKMGPNYIDVPFSIDIVIFVAVGGRGTLFGAVLGTFLVHYGTSYIGEAVKDLRPIILGLLFVGTVLLMPTGLLGTVRALSARLTKNFKRTAAP